MGQPDVVQNQQTFAPRQGRGRILGCHLTDGTCRVVADMLAFVQTNLRLIRVSKFHKNRMVRYRNIRLIICAMNVEGCSERGHPRIARLDGKCPLRISCDFEEGLSSQEPYFSDLIRIIHGDGG